MNYLVFFDAISSKEYLAKRRKPHTSLRVSVGWIGCQLVGFDAPQIDLPRG
jgi:hypothetical protein